MPEICLNTGPGKAAAEDLPLTEYLTEQEQIELLKSWIKQYSLVVLAGIAIAVAGISGWRYWQDREFRMMSHASEMYDVMLTKRAQNDTAGLTDQAQRLYKDYLNTPYGQIAGLTLARNAVAQNHLSEAESYLDKTLHKSNIAAIRQIARLRLARVLIAEQKPQDAINVLAKVNDTSFNGLTDEVRGDAYLAMNNIAQARQSYQSALQELPNAEVTRPLLRMKYDNLATVDQPAS